MLWEILQPRYFAYFPTLQSHEKARKTPSFVLKNDLEDVLQHSLLGSLRHAENCTWNVAMFGQGELCTNERQSMPLQTHLVGPSA